MLKLQLFFLTTEPQDMEPLHKEMYVENYLFNSAGIASTSSLLDVLQWKQVLE